MKDMGKKALVDMCYGHPKSLEFLINIFRSFSSDFSLNYRTLFSRLSEALNGKYSFNFNPLALLQACLCYRQALNPESSLVPGTSITFGNAIANGFFYNDLNESAVPFVTPLFLYNYLKNSGDPCSLIGEMLISCESGPDEMDSFGGERFEIFHLCWEALIRIIWPGEYLTLIELYKLPRNISWNAKFHKRLKVGSRYSPFLYSGKFKDFLEKGKTRYLVTIY